MPAVQLDLTVDAAPTAARDARRAVAHRQLVSSEQEATLLLRKHKRERLPLLGRDEHIRLRARCDRVCAYVEVCDAGHSGRVPAKRDGGGALNPGGLGLVLVDEMADRWGVARTGGETCVWFELACE